LKVRYFLDSEPTDRIEGVKDLVASPYEIQSELQLFFGRFFLFEPNRCD